MKKYYVDATGEMLSKEELEELCDGFIPEEFEDFDEYFDAMVMNGTWKEGKLVVLDNIEDKIVKEIDGYCEGNELIRKLEAESKDNGDLLPPPYNPKRYTVELITE